MRPSRTKIGLKAIGPPGKIVLKATGPRATAAALPEEIAATPVLKAAAAGIAVPMAFAGNGAKAVRVPAVAIAGRSRWLRKSKSRS